MRLDPSLLLKRLVVSRNGKAVYDEEFRSGVNIIRGENGSGKSTIADFIFFALGGERSSLTKHAALCDMVTAELSVNGEPVTVQRAVAPERRRPMTIFWGSLGASGAADLSRRELFPFASSESKQSFSSVLFDALGIPEVRGGLSSRITMHQLLRVMYVD